MGTDITTYQVSLKKLRELCQKGSTHRAEIVEKFKDKLARLDASFHHGEEPARDLVSALLRGEQGTQLSAHKTAYTLELLCGYVGAQISSAHFAHLLRPFDDFFSFVELWRQTKIPFAIENIGEGSFQPPIQLLPPRDWPHIVTFEAEEVRAAHKAIALFQEDKGPGWQKFNQVAGELRQRLPGVKALDLWLDCQRFGARCAQDAEQYADSYLGVELSFITAISDRTNDEWGWHFEEQVNDNFSSLEKFLPALMDSFQLIEGAARAEEGLVMFVY